jgi:hypothetical protein
MRRSIWGFSKSYPIFLWGWMGEKKGVRGVVRSVFLLTWPGKAMTRVRRSGRSFERHRLCVTFVSNINCT